MGNDNGTTLHTTTVEKKTSNELNTYIMHIYVETFMCISFEFACDFSAKYLRRNVIYCDEKKMCIQR